MSAFKNNNNDALKTVVSNLGLDDAIEMLEYALPRIIQRQEELQHCMSVGDWKAAQQCAHKTISSVRLYGSEVLEALLQQVKYIATDEVDPIRLEQQLSTEFEIIITRLKQWLAAHTP